MALTIKGRQNYQEFFFAVDPDTKKNIYHLVRRVLPGEERKLLVETKLNRVKRDGDVQELAPSNLARFSVLKAGLAWVGTRVGDHVPNEEKDRGLELRATEETAADLSKAFDKPLDPDDVVEMERGLFTAASDKVKTWLLEQEPSLSDWFCSKSDEMKLRAAGDEEGKGDS